MKVKAVGVDQSALALTISEHPTDRFRKQARRGLAACRIRVGVSEVVMLMSDEVRRSRIRVG